MELQKAILGRHSIRSFKKDAISVDILLKLADAGQAAPTTSNMQSWRFLFVTDSELKQKVDLFAQGLSGKPPVILVMCSDMEVALKKGGKNAEIYGCMIDAALAAENIMLQAVEYGLGTCLIKSYDESAIREILHIPERYRIEMLMSIGYPDGEARCPMRPNIENVAYFNRFPELMTEREDLDVKEELVNSSDVDEMERLTHKMTSEQEMLIYMLISAKALPNEPSAYGLLRLLEAAKRVCNILLQREPENHLYMSLKSCFESRKEKNIIVDEAIQLLLK